MNAAGLRNINNNVRIILVNNGGGSEFHFFIGKEKISTINEYICAEHGNVAAGWIMSLGYDYYSASTKEEFDEIIDKFNQKNDRANVSLKPSQIWKTMHGSLKNFIIIIEMKFHHLLLKILREVLSTPARSKKSRKF